MKRFLYVAIDPGLSGAIVMEDHHGRVDAYDMPSDASGIRDIFQLCLDHEDILKPILCERVGGFFPGNSGPSAVKFAEHVGLLKGLMIGMKIPFDLVAPAVWMKQFMNGPIVYPSSLQATAKKAYRKSLIKDNASNLFPTVKVTLKNSDALGMLWCATNINKS